MVQVISFSEFPVGTTNPTFEFIDNNVYTQGGIRTDGSNPTSPVLAGSADSFFPPVSISFLNPVDFVSLDAGYFDNTNSTRVLFVGWDGSILSEQFNSGLGIESFSFSATGTAIGGVSIVAVAQEDAGFAVDNLVFGDPFVAPELQTNQGNAETLEVWLDFINQAEGMVFEGTVGPTDVRDVFGFFAPTDVRVTFEVISNSSPDSTEEYVEDFSLGTHFFEIEDVERYDFETGYSLVVKSVEDISDETADQARQKGIDLAQTLLKLGVVDKNKLGADLISVLHSADDVRSFYKGIADGLGKASVFLDVFFSLDNVLLADNKPREAFIQAVSFGAGLLASWGGAAGGAAIGAWFAGVGAAVGGPLGGFGSGIVYTFAIADEVESAAGTFWDTQIEPDQENLVLTMASVKEVELLQFEVEGNSEVEAILFDVEWYLETYPDAAEAVFSGAYPSAYVHFLLEGAESGYRPNPNSAPIDASELAGSDSVELAQIATADTRWGVYQAHQTGDLVGDGVSPEEQAVFEAMLEERTIGVAYDLDAGLSALANRKAIDLVHNFGNNPAFLEATGGSDWFLSWSSGAEFEEGASSILDGIGPDLGSSFRIYVFVSNAITPYEVLEELSQTLDGRSLLYDTTHESVGIAEYGGVWVFVSSNDSGTVPFYESNESFITRWGSDASDMMSLGTWGGELNGEGGRDYLEGGNKDDVILGGGSDDVLNGNDGDDTILGNTGADEINGGDGNDSLIGGNGSDVILGGRGADYLEGGFQNDDLHGGGGNDKLFGGLGRDILKGGNLNDIIRGEEGQDRLRGGEGQDTLIGGLGADFLYGGSGRDSFIYLSASESQTGAGADRIFDFVQGEDVLNFSSVSRSDLTFIGTTSFSGTNSEVRIVETENGNTSVFVDREGDGEAEMRVVLIGVTGLTEADFIL